MAIRTARRTVVVLAILCALSCVLLIASCGKSRTVKPDEVSQLGPAVADFLDQWLAKGQAQAALQKHWSAGASDVRLVPAEAYSAAEYKRMQARTATTAPTPDRANVVGMTAGLLARWSGADQSGPQGPPGQPGQPGQPNAKPLVAAGGADLLAPLGPKDDPELWRTLREDGIQPTPLDGTRALVYRVRRTADYRWAAPATVGYKTIIPQRINEGLDVQGVIGKIRAGNSSWIILMFWVDEARGTPQVWRLWGLTPVPTS